LQRAQEDIRKILNEHGVEELTAKVVRQKLEAAFGMEDGALKPKKQEISSLIDEIINEQNEDGDEEEEEEEEKPPPKKKAKKEKKEEAEEDGDGDGEPRKAKMTCVTKSGDECPKQIKALQEKLKISQKQFLASDTLEVDIAGNVLTGEPRSFSSGNLGWYLGGKCEMSVGNKTVWAQVGINISIPGSSNWK